MFEVIEEKIVIDVYMDVGVKGVEFVLLELFLIILLVIGGKILWFIV